MEFRKLAENGPVMLIPKVFKDGRGCFFETFRQNEFEEHCGIYQFVQDNQSKSTGNVLRGIHYQLNHPQGKLVRVISGKVFDVAVDLRKSSPNFGQAYGVVLDNETNASLWVPPGFGHGFCVMGESAEFVYKCTAYYKPGDEYTLLWNDPVLNITWPVVDPVLSEKDKKGVPLAQAKVYD